MLKTFVKISQVTNLSDARYCAGMGVDLLGFSMDEISEAYVSPQKLEEIKSWIAGVKIVGETQSADSKEISQLLNAYSVDYLQISHISLLPEIQQFNKPILVVLEYSKDFLKGNLFAFAPLVDFFIVEGISFSEKTLLEIETLANDYPILVGVGKAEHNFLHILSETLIKGLQIKAESLVELQDILENLEIDV